MKMKNNCTVAFVVMVMVLPCQALDYYQSNTPATIDSNIEDYITIYSPESNLPCSRVSIISGGKVDGGNVFDCSLLNVHSGRSSGNIHIYDTGQVEMFKGYIESIEAEQNSSITIRDGIVGNISGLNNSHVIMFGGILNNGLDLYDNSKADIYDGTLLDNFEAFDQSETQISGGNIVFGRIDMHDSSRLEITGGQISLGGCHNAMYFVNDNALLTFDGRDFHVDGEPVSGLMDLEVLVLAGVVSKNVNNTVVTYTGGLSGELSDGSVFDNLPFYIRRDTALGDTANIELTSNFCNYYLPGDFNNDCIFNMLDLAVMSQNWLVDCNTDPLNPVCTALQP